MNIQSGIVQEVPAQARYLFYSLDQKADAGRLVSAIQSVSDGERVIVGLGAPFFDLVGNQHPQLPNSPVYSGAGIAIPAMPYAIWFWLRGPDRGDLVNKTLQIEEAMGDAVRLEDVVDGFKYRDGRDLSGYIDGTENPEGDAAMEAGFSTAGNDSGGSCVAVQKWLHDLVLFRELAVDQQDAIIGRRVSDNEEMSAAPVSAHVKRAEQEAYSPEAYMLRRSMPWADSSGEGLVFVAFGKSFDAFDKVMRRMLGCDDGITDGLFEFSRCLGTSFFWCPPMKNGALVLPVAE